MSVPEKLRRRAGLVVPLFSLPSSRSWGIGEMSDIPRLAGWLRDARLSVLQILPINETAPGDHSPYSAFSAMAIDPQYVSMLEVPEFVRDGGEDRLDSATRAALARARQATSVRYDVVRRLKRQALRRAFERFYEGEWLRDSARAASLAAYIDEQSWWLDDYALFRALHQAHGERPWTEWEVPVRNREAAALESARQALARDLLHHQYVQWIAEGQWQQARTESNGIFIFGDFPFMVAADSADVWIHQDDFRLDASVGTPPDAFSETGQNWGVPAYRWDVARHAHLEWLGQRARRAAALFDGLRIDHVVGFYRTYVIGHDRSRGFVPQDEADQLAQGETILQMFLASGAKITAEDLGTVPDFVRESLARLNVPGYRVFRWERRWHEQGKPFIDPVEFPRASVATTGTHDIEPLAEWWESLSADERRSIGRIPSLRDLAPNIRFESAPFDDRLRDLFLEALYAAESDLLLLPVQDVFGWRDRINVPATVARDNWTYRLPWRSDSFATEPGGLERSEFLAGLAQRYRRD